MAERILTLFVDNANGFRMQNVQRNSLANPGPLNTATVQVRVQTLLGVDVPLTITSWPLTLAYVAGSSGDYEGFLAPDDMVLDDEQNYHVVFTINDVSFGPSGPIRYLAVAKRVFR